MKQPHIFALLILALALNACTLNTDPVPAGPIHEGAEADSITLRAPDVESEFEIGAEAYLLAMATASPAPAPPPAIEIEQGADGTTGVITGQVQGVDGGPPPGGLPLTLRGIDPAEPGPLSAEFLVVPGRTTADGGYRFEGVPFEIRGAIYRVSTTQDGVTFSAEVEAGPGTAQVTMPLALYAITSSTAALRADTLGMRIDGRNGVIEVAVVYSLTNITDSVYATSEAIQGGARGGIALTVPDGAYNITLSDGRADLAFQQQGDQVITHDPLWPGPLPYPVVLRYLLPPAASIEMPTFPPIQAEQVVLLLDPAYQVTALGGGQVSTFAGVPYREYTAGEVEAGGLAFTINPAVTDDDNRTTFAIALGLAAGLLLTAYGVTIALTSVPPPTLKHLDRDGARLLRAIAALDARYRAGEIDRIRWQADRAALKADLAERLENTQ